MFVRRVVTGVNADGKSVVVSDEQLDGIRPSLLPGSEVHAVWGTDTLPDAPNSGAVPTVQTTYPLAGGIRFGLFNVLPTEAPHGAPENGAVSPDDALAEYEALRPGVLQYFEPGGTGMHSTPTVDVAIVLAGEVCIELDDRVEVGLSEGDIVVQNGTRHAWRNHTAAPARLAVVMVGANPSGPTPSDPTPGP